MVLQYFFCTVLYFLLIAYFHTVRKKTANATRWKIEWLLRYILDLYNHLSRVYGEKKTTKIPDCFTGYPDFCCDPRYLTSAATMINAKSNVQYKQVKNFGSLHTEHSFNQNFSAFFRDLPGLKRFDRDVFEANLSSNRR
jgi:hypothetical protein